MSAETGKSNLVTIITAVISAITGLLVAYNTLSISQFEADLKKVESERELNFRIYKSISEALEAENPKRIIAVRAIVEKLASQDLRQGFLDALDSGEVNIFEKDEAEKAIPIPVSINSTKNTKEIWHNWNYDVFWCSRSGSHAEGLAEVVAATFTDNNVGSRIRTRVLPESVRTRPGFGEVKPFQIRVEKGIEENNSKNISEFIKSKTRIQQEFEIFKVSSSYKSKDYISIFICPVLSSNMIN